MAAQPQKKQEALVSSKGAETSVEFQAFGSSEKVKLSIAIVRKWLVAPTRSGKTATDSDVMKFIMLCKARQLNPWEGDAFLVGYDSNNGPSFSLITAHQAFLKRAEVHTNYDGMESGVIVEENGVLRDLPGDFLLPTHKLLGAWAKVYRKDQSHPKVARLNVETFDKDRAQWKTNKAGMIVKCAEADALRGAFPNTLGGLYNDAEMSMAAGKEAGQIGGLVETVIPTPEVITEDQRVSLINLATDLGVTEKLGEIVNAHGFELVAYITTDRFLEISNAIREAAGEVSPGEVIQGEAVLGGESDDEEAGDDEAIEADTTAIDSEEEKAKSKLADLRTAAFERYRELEKGDKAEFERANKFLGTKGIPELGADKLTDFLNLDFSK